MPESAQPGSEWTEVYSSATGDKQVVPSRWLDHRVLSKGIRKTPLSKSRESQNPVETTNTPAAGDKEK